MDIVDERTKIQAIYKLIKLKGELTLREIEAEAGVNYNTVRASVRSLLKRGLIKRTGRGTYSKV